MTQEATEHKDDGVALDDDLLWGAAEIGRAIGRDARQMAHLLRKHSVPARRVGGTWVASRSKLRTYIEGTTAG